MKNYKASDAAYLIGKNYHALRKMLVRDEAKKPADRNYPHAYKNECGCWMIPGKDLFK